MYACWVEVGNKESEIGNIWDILNQKELVNMYRLNYFLWSPFDYKECLECKFLPICMGGCPHCAKQNNKPDCQEWRYNIIEKLKLTYDKQNNKENDINNGLKYIVKPEKVDF